MSARDQAKGTNSNVQLWQAIAGRRGVGSPESLALFTAWLESLGLKVDLQPAEKCASLAVLPATDNEQIERSGGVVRKPETLNYRTYEDCDDGLFCPKVFGPSGGRRRRKFGHVVLSAAIVPIIWRLGKPSLLETLLGLPGSKIEKLVRREADVFARDGKLRFEKRPVDSAADLTAEGWLLLGTGAEAVRTLLSRIPREKLPAGLQDRLHALTSTVVNIPPPDLRPLVLLDSGNFATHDANDLIRRVVNRSNRLSKLVQLNAPQVILDNEDRMLQLGVDALHANSLIPSKDAVRGSGKEKRRLKCLLDMVVEYLLEPDGKRVDWCGRARAVISPHYLRDHAFLPESMFLRLKLNETEPVLLTAGEGDGRFIARLPRPISGSALHLDERAAEELGLPHGTPSCIVHRPLGPAAKSEALQLLHGPPSVAERTPRSGGWLEGTTALEIASGLAHAAATGEKVYLDSPTLLALGGLGNIDFAPDHEPMIRGDEYRQAVIPPE